MFCWKCRFCGNTRPVVIRAYCHPLNFRPSPNVLYRNTGGGTFTDDTRRAGVAGDLGNGLGIAVGDYDDDQWPDLFVANDGLPNFLCHNDGKGRFTDTSLAAGVSVALDGRARAGMGTAFGDADGDGRLDLAVTNQKPHRNFISVKAHPATVFFRRITSIITHIPAPGEVSDVGSGLTSSCAAPS